MTATVHQLPGIQPTPAPAMTPPADASIDEQRMWWLGYAAGHQQRSNEYETNEAAMLAAAERFLTSKGFGTGLRVVK
ncbi:hypothetical protein ABZ949_01990 [Micromonospora tulbaghiae]|uniref:hypothetical protein n=1 Tax=Micromonospora tulbaghiae TaxID=479978 RepID=UPI00340EF72F